ncbi:protein BOLA2-like [Gigantopelta aegis]|uniref:protein BOLA2-like n=1 Tax=Gigantopelta aegis TaxID=1735272 RepID=UPI001B887934|nr:protein BOLA2-like [Gigantopelta aegis]
MSSMQEKIESKLKQALDTTHLEVVDASDGCGAKFQVLVVSPQFEGKPLLQRHRLVNSTLEEEMKSIHAFQMKTLTPQQWQQQQTN